MFLCVTVYRYAWLVKVCHYKHQEYNHVAERHYPACSNDLISKSAFEFLQSFWVFLAVSRIKLSIAGICNHLLIPAKIALESCCLSYFVCTLALLSTCQSCVSLNCELLFVLNAATWMVLDSFFSLAFQTTVKFPHPVSNFRELLSCFFLFCLISVENLQWHPIFRNKLVRSTNSTLQTAFHYYLR